MHVYEKSTVWLASVGLAQVRPNKLQSSHYVYPATVAVGKVDEHQPNKDRYVKLRWRFAMHNMRCQHFWELWSIMRNGGLQGLVQFDEISTIENVSL